MANKGILGPF